MPLFFADECVAALIIDGLRSRGLDVVSASELCPGETDDRVLALAAEAGRIVITNDQGFGELAVRHSQPVVGVIILSLYELPAGARERYAVERILDVAERVEGHLAVIEPSRVRLRPLPDLARE